GWIVEDMYLRRALLDAIAQTALPYLSGASVTAVARDTSCAALTLSDGREIRAELAVAADGRRSSLAAEAGIRRLGWSYAQTGLVNAVEHDRPHNGVAHQSFFPGGPFAVLPLTDGRSSLVWSEQRMAAERLAALSDEAFTSEIAHRIGGRLGEVRLIGKRWAYPLDLTLASAYAAPRLALVGDAAHGVHPIAGQGMNMGLRDVAALTEVLIDAARIGEDLGNLAVLDRYQRWRRFNATTLAFGMDGLNRLFSNNSAALSTLRRAGLRAVDGLDTLRRGFMREAIGAQGDAPKLLRGEAP
ncbi:MAG: FAD-dependent monooxygenase, partial [Pseudomonadota bacterium]